MSCRLCKDTITNVNTATFKCGHTFHLSCIFMRHFSSQCPQCNETTTSLPDVGVDREVAITSAIASKIQQRQLQCVPTRTIFKKITDIISPLTPSLQHLADNVYHNKSLHFISLAGFSPKDAVHERIKWNKIAETYESADILEFGFLWEHMVDMGITPKEVKMFSWQQQRRLLNLDAHKLLQTNISLSELADFKYTTHQLLELGFSWNVMMQMGASVDNWRMFGFSLEDIKQYWNPSLTDLVSAGFYDKERLVSAGWDLESVLQTLPNMTDRSSGRVLRLAF